MSKKKARQLKEVSVPRRKGWGRWKTPGAIILVLSLMGLVLAQLRSIRPVFTVSSPTPTVSPTPKLAKEYIYAGDRLVAIEEPSSGGGPSPLSAPTSLTADGTSTPGSQVNLSWMASTGGTVNHYQVERSQNISSGYTVVAANVSTTNYTDTNVSADSAYLYRVRAVDADGNFSSYGNPDLATAITFADDPLNPNGMRTLISAQHLIELRRAVNAVRLLAGLPTASWTYPDPGAQPQQRRNIYLEDVTDLRGKLDEALNLLGRLQPYDPDPPLTRNGPVMAAHFTQIRERVK